MDVSFRHPLSFDFEGEHTGRRNGPLTHHFLIALLLFVAIASPGYSAEAEFSADKPTPLKLLDPGDKPSISFKFAGRVQLSGRFVAAWQVKTRGQSNLYVAFFPSPGSAALLPRMNTDRPVTELRLTDPKRAATKLLDPTTMRKLLAKEILSAEGEATVVVHRYIISVVCDQRWYEAKLIDATKIQNIVFGARENIPYGCG
jgi:hypothetical protein